VHRRRIGTFALIALVGLLTRGYHHGAAAPATMSTESTAQALALYTQALDAGTASASYFAPDAVLTFADSGRQVTGQVAVARAIEDLYHGTFAGRMTVTSIIVGHGETAVAGQFVGTQLGPYAGLAATGHSVTVPYTAFYELADGWITALRLDLSTAEVLRQLTAAPADGAPSPGQRGKAF
jgi:predicted ester cyclase